MSDLGAVLDAMDLLKARSQEFYEWLPKMEATLVSYRCEDAFQRFQCSYYAENGEHYCYTISDWLALDLKAKQELIGKNVMLIKPRTEPIRIPGALLFMSKRYYSQQGEEFITVKDAYGFSGQPFTPSHSY